MYIGVTKRYMPSNKKEKLYPVLSSIIIPIVKIGIDTTIVNIFIGSQNIDFVINIVGIIVFLMFTAYDVNHVLPNSNYMYGDSKGAIYAAFQIYLDYINLFLRIIQIIGKNKDN